MKAKNLTIHVLIHELLSVSYMKQLLCLMLYPKFFSLRNS